MRILIVEDDIISRFILQKILSEFGQCDIAVNGREAIDIFSYALNEGLPYNLICLDIMMPDLDGRNALLKIREKEKEMNILPENQVKIIMVTALDSPKEVIEAYFKGGCDSYLVKPIEKRKMLEKLKELGMIA